MGNRALEVSVDIPDIDITITVHLSKDRRMDWRPLHVIDVLLATFKGVDRHLHELVLRIPQLHSPVHGSTQHQLRHI